MSTAKPHPSFSPGRRWKIAFDVVLRTALMLVVVAALNYLAATFYTRFFLSSQTSVKLSSRTVAVLNSITNDVKVTLYLDRSRGDKYPEVVALLDEYRAICKKITVRTVDYTQNPGEAQKLKEKYNLNTAADKNLVIFDSGGRVKVVPAEALTQTALEQVPNPTEREFRRRPVTFNGEMIFTAMLLALESPQPLKAYFLQGHGEPSLEDSGNFGYQKFLGTIRQNYVTVELLQILGESPVPMDCNLLIVAAPTRPLTEAELQKIDRYLREGGRMLALFNYESLKSNSGLEPILQRWGVNVLADTVRDPDNTVTGQDVVAREFGKHPVAAPLTQLSLQMVLPRPVLKVESPASAVNPPQIDELVLSSPASRLAADSAARPRAYSIACAVEQKPVAGVATPRGTTRIIAVGDSIFLGNYYIEGGGNRDFLNASVNWLLDRPQLVTGIAPRSVTEYRLNLTQQQQGRLAWILLAGLPGAVLFLGWIVWFVRRK